VLARSAARSVIGKARLIFILTIVVQIWAGVNPVVFQRGFGIRAIDGAH